MKYITIIDIFSKSLYTIAIFIFIDSESDYILVPLVSGAGYLIGTLLSLYYIFYRFKFSFLLTSYRNIRATFIDSSMFFLSRVSVSLYTTSNIFVLGLVSTTTMVGYYAVAEKLYTVIRHMYQPVVQVVYPYISKQKI